MFGSFGCKSESVSRLEGTRVKYSCISSKIYKFTSLVVAHFSMLDVMRRLVEAENALFGLVKVSKQFLVFLLLRHPMTVVTLLAPFPAKIGGISHCGLDQAMMNKPLTYLGCSDLALPGLILSGLLAFFPSPMK